MAAAPVRHEYELEDRSMTRPPALDWPMPPQAGAGKCTGNFFVLEYNAADESFAAGLLYEGNIVQVGAFSRGLIGEERDSLTRTVIAHAVSSSRSRYRVRPGICVELAFDTIADGKLVNPEFRSFQLAARWEDCTWDRLLVDNASARRQGLKLTNPDKRIWEDKQITKEKYWSYLIQISPYLLPFLERRTLTLIRYPQGMEGDFFYQKHCPDYAPDWIQTEPEDGISYIVCNDLPSLLWLGNQAAVEFHIPFHQIGMNKPYEIVFDLDPPSRDRFDLAVKAALEMKRILDGFGIVGYPKVSGGKGLQIHIPVHRLPSVDYDAARVFTSFAARYLTEKFPNEFTVERLKKNRGGKLYVDYIQHAPGKTIVAPYSARGNWEATVAAPLYWDEVNAALSPSRFTVPDMPERLRRNGCPMRDYREQTNEPLLRVISQLKANAFAGVT